MAKRVRPSYQDEAREKAENLMKQINACANKRPCRICRGMIAAALERFYEQGLQASPAPEGGAHPMTFLLLLALTQIPTPPPGFVVLRCSRPYEVQMGHDVWSCDVPNGVYRDQTGAVIVMERYHAQQMLGRDPERVP